MRNKIDYTFTTLLIILGVCHTALTPLFYKIFDLNSLWFAGTGLAFVFLGLINIIRIKTVNKSLKILSLSANAMGFIYCILIVIKIPQPQAYTCLTILTILFMLSFFDLRLSENIHLQIN